MSKVVEPIFPDLDTNALRDLLPPDQLVQHESGELILEEGAEADCCYLVLSGRVQLSRRRKSGKEIKLSEISSGQFFGEMGLLSGMHRSASATALTEVEIMQINPEDLRRLIDENHPLALQLGFHFATSLARRSGSMLKLLAESPATDPKKLSKKDEDEMPVDVRNVLHEVYSLWAI